MGSVTPVRSIVGASVPLEEVLPETAPLPEEEPAPPSVLQPDSRDKVKAADRVMAPKRFKFMWSNSFPFRTAGPGNFIIA